MSSRSSVRRENIPPSRSFVNIYVTGFMGTGKTVVGRRLARKLNRHFVDLDSEIVRTTRRSIPHIFSEDGERAFRRLEDKVFRRFAVRKKSVVALGGGTLLNRQNMLLARKTGVIVCLEASLEVILQRVGNAGERPLLNLPGNLPEREQRRMALARIRAMLARRRSVYQQSDFFVNTSRRSVAQVAAAVQSVLEKC